MAHARVPPRIRRVQASALALLVIAGTLNYVDRAALSIANPLHPLESAAFSRRTPIAVIGGTAGQSSQHPVGA